MAPDTLARVTPNSLTQAAEFESGTVNKVSEANSSNILEKFGKIKTIAKTPALAFYDDNTSKDGKEHQGKV